MEEWEDRRRGGGARGPVSLTNTYSDFSQDILVDVQKHREIMGETGRYQR